MMWRLPVIATLMGLATLGFLSCSVGELEPAVTPGPVSAEPGPFTRPPVTTTPFQALTRPLATPTPWPPPTRPPATRQPVMTGTTLAPGPQPTRTPWVTAPAWLYTGADVRLAGWSPDGRYLAVFTYSQAQLDQGQAGLPGTAPGDFVIYDTSTGAACTDYPLDATYPHEGPGQGRRFTWLPGGDLFTLSPDGRALRAAFPCAPEAPLGDLFPEPLQRIESLDPPGQRLLVTGATAYWLWDLSRERVYPLAEIQPDPFHNLVWSPDGAFLAVTLAGNYDGRPDPVGGSRIIDAATGALVTTYDWVPYHAIDGVLGGPVWLDEGRLVITTSRDQGPFILDWQGQVTPVLTLFAMDDGPLPALPAVQVATHPALGSFTLLLTDGAGAAPPRLYDSLTGGVERLDGVVEPWLTARGEVFTVVTDMIGDLPDGFFWIDSRPAFPPNSPFRRSPDPYCYWPTRPPEAPSVAVSTGPGLIQLFTASGGCTPSFRVQLAGYEAAQSVWRSVAPDGRGLATLVEQPETGERALLYLGWR